MQTYDPEKPDLQLVHFQTGQQVNFWFDGQEHHFSGEHSIICHDHDNLIHWMNENDAMKNMRALLNLRLEPYPLYLHHVPLWRIQIITPEWNDLIANQCAVEESWPLLPWESCPAEYPEISSWSWAYRLPVDSPWLVGLPSNEPESYNVEIPCTRCNKNMIRYPIGWSRFGAKGKVYWIPDDPGMPVNQPKCDPCWDEYNKLQERIQELTGDLPPAWHDPSVAGEEFYEEPGVP